MGLLNIGVEEIKGIEEVRQAHAWLKENDLPIDYRGFVEGDQIGQGIVDVVVVEGFAGNIALKTAEGTAKQIGEYLREAMTSSLAAKLGAVAGRRRLARPEGQHGPAARQRRPVPRPQRHCHQESRRHRRFRLCQRHRGRLRHGRRATSHGAARSRSGRRSTASSGERRGEAEAGSIAPWRAAVPSASKLGQHEKQGSSGNHSIGDPRRRRLSAQAHHDQRRPGAHRRHHATSGSASAPASSSATSPTTAS